MAMQKGILLVFEGGQVLKTTTISLFAFLPSLTQGLWLSFYSCLSGIIMFYHLCKALSLVGEKKTKPKHNTQKRNNLLMSQAQLFYLNKIF